MMERIVDTHVHLTWPTYNGQVQEVVARANRSGVAAILDLGTDVSSSLRAAEHARQFESVWYGAGIHPNDVSKAATKDLDTISTLLDGDKCAALGEIGLDYYREHSAPELQEEWFRKQLKLAKAKGKPVVLHDRKASSDLLRVLDDENFNGVDGPGGVFHCFAGDKVMAREVIERGFYISFTGNITYKKSDRPEVSLLVPDDRLLLETDSPFLAPVPRRGRDNEPSYVTYIAAAHAAIRDMTLNDVARITTENAQRLFGFTFNQE